MIIIFRNLQFLNDYIELIKSFLLKKIPGKKCFFCADFWSAKVFSLLIILIDPRQVLSYLIRIPLLNQANHAIWQKSLSISIVLAVFSWILEVNASKEKKKSMSVFVLELRIRSGLHSRKVELSHVKYFHTFVSTPNYVSPIGANNMRKEDEVEIGLNWIENFQPVWQRTIWSAFGSLPQASWDYVVLFAIVSKS